ncbi:hypothetical protein LEN26_010256 [Aphanomyces euteiches]|nr:hypothetical protein AeMF1_018507 [Aphanomyces euteiches]KAH9122428.1 hypothetical protein LEN26_010256 [Aphanomyces euteiches]KAH9194872.1 hypothetical protein AeNC1_003149 [Aphanomyces euteiches]
MACHVLSSIDLLSCVFSYQDGLVGALWPLLSLSHPSLDDLEHLDVDTFAQSDCVLRPWYTQHALTRMDALTRSSHLRDLVVLHAVYYDQLDVLECMARRYFNDCLDDELDFVWYD